MNPDTTRTNSSAAPAKRPRRRLVLGLLLLLLLAAAAAILILPRLLDPESHRARIEAALREATGWDAELGEIDVSIWRGAALAVTPARLAAPGDGSSAEIERIEVGAELWPLLRGELRIGRVDLIRPTIELVRRSEAEGWSVPGSGSDGPADVPPAAGSPAPGSAPAPDGAPGAEPSFRVAIERVRVRDGRLRIEDRAVDPPWSTELTEVAIDGRPEEGRATGSGTLDGGGRVEFDVSADGPAWRMDRLQALVEGVRVEGEGPLLPSVDLVLRLPETDLEETLRAAETLFPLPLALSGPGTVRAEARVRQPEGGDLTITAEGELSAARFDMGETLPDARDVRAGFTLDPAGALEIRAVSYTHLTLPTN